MLLLIEKLVEKYEKNRNHYISTKYNETLLRSDFLDSFFELLGWDIKNEQGKSTFEREVILEESLQSVNEHSKKPDYTFRLFNERKFFLEAKKPSVNIEKSNEAAQQIRRYGFTAKLKISVLSNFEHLLIYDCSHEIQHGDNANKALIKKYHYTEYVRCFDEIKSLIGKDSVYDGSFDEIWKEIEHNLEKFNVDTLFINQISKWRLMLGNAICNFRPNISEVELNDCVQSYINSIVFLRVCEDRNIEKYQTLLKTKDGQDFNLLLSLFKTADIRYNSGIFNLPYKDKLIEKISSVFWDIISELYFPNSSYSFAVFSSDILGNIYEIFLRDQLYVKNKIVTLDKKPENINRDAVTTPLFIIQNILDKTLVDFIKDKDLSKILDLKIADIACGSGAFLLEAYQYICDYLIDFYLKADASKLVKIGINSYKLDFGTKIKVLTGCIYGIDKDFNAVMAAKFGLLLKVLENECIDTLPHGKEILPELEHIICGNSLINRADATTLNSNDKMAVNPFDFNKLKFDVIVGNPPYMKTEDIKNLTPLEKSIYEKKFKSAHKQYDKYFLFVESSLCLLNKNGVAGYILPSKFTKVEAGTNLRKMLKDNEAVKELISFGANQVFADKTTYTNILILSKQHSKALNYLEVNNLPSWKLKKYNDKNNNNLIEVNDLSDETWILFPNKLTSLYNKINQNSLPLNDFVENRASDKRIFNGIQTSRNDFYVFKPQKEDADYFYFEKEDKLWAIEKSLTRPYYETPNSDKDDSLNTYRLFKPNSYVIYPYKFLEDKIVYIEIAELRKNYPKGYEYLLKNKQHFISSAKGGKRDIKPEPQTKNEWYRYGRHQALSMGVVPQKIVVGVLSQGNKYAIDNNRTMLSSGGTAGYCMITLPASSLYSIYYLQAVLNSKPLEWMASLYGEIFRGGYIARGTKVLQKLPIKTIDFANKEEKQLHDEIAKTQETLIGIQSEIDTNSENQRKIEFLKQEFIKNQQLLDKFLMSLYGLSTEEYGQIPNIKEFYATT